MGFQLNPEVGAGLAAMMGPDGPPPPLPVGDIENRRLRLDAVFKAVSENTPKITGVDVKDISVEAEDGHKLLARWFTSTMHPSPGSAVLYSHGGGHIALSLDIYDQIIKNYVSNTGVPILAIDYRLAPEVQAPVPVADCYAGLQYLHSNAATLGIDPTRIAIMGDSGGGGISASLTHYAKQKGGPAIAKQILIYPMLDDRNTDHSAHEAIAPFLSWSVDDNITGWQALLGKDKCGTSDVPPIHAAARSTVSDAKGLPPAYIDVGELDLFRDEDLQYTRILGQAGVSCELHVVPGCPHAFEAFAPASQVAKEIFGKRFQVLQTL